MARIKIYLKNSKDIYKNLYKQTIRAQVNLCIFFISLLTYLILYPSLQFTYICYSEELRKKEHPVPDTKKNLSQIEFNQRKSESFLLWFHVASVGEGMSILPLIENLEKEEKIRKNSNNYNYIKFSRSFTKKTH